jgi:FtsH-binding integral membrane protein
MLTVPWLIVVLFGALAMVLALLAAMHRVSPRKQFVILAAMGVSLGFLFLVMVQAPKFPVWFGAMLIAIVFFASTFGTRIFMRSLAREERLLESEAAGGAMRSSNSGAGSSSPLPGAHA